MSRTYSVILDTSDDGRTRIEPLRKILVARYKKKGQFEIIEESSLGDAAPFSSFTGAAEQARARALRLMKLHPQATLSIGSARFVVGWGPDKWEVTCLSLADQGGPVMGTALLDPADRGQIAEMIMHQSRSLEINSKGGADPKVMKLALYITTELGRSLIPESLASN